MGFALLILVAAGAFALIHLARLEAKGEVLSRGPRLRLGASPKRQRQPILQAPPGATPEYLLNVYLGVRQLALLRTPQELNLTNLGPGDVYGAVLELSAPEVSMTVVAFATGDASLYFSTGGGVLGGLDSPSARAAAENFVKVAQENLGLLTPTDTFPRPEVGDARFHVLTPGGGFTRKDSEEAAMRGETPLAPLFQAGWRVFAAMRDPTVVSPA